jgi:MFS family permease
MTTHSLWPRNITLLLASTMTVMAGATIAPALPGMEQHFQNVAHAELLVKLVMAAPGLMIALAAPLVGMLLDRSHKKRILISSAILYGAAGTSGFFLEESLYAILAGRMLLGVAVAGIMVTCTTLIGDYFDGEKRHHYMGLQAAFGGFGGVLFLALGGWLADFGWRPPFLIYLLAFLILPGLLIFIREPEKAKAHHATGPGPQGGFLTPFTLMCFALAILEILVLYMVPVHFPFYASSLGLGGGTQTGLAIALMMLVMSTMSMFYKVFKAKASFTVLHGLGLAILGVGYLLLGSAHNTLTALLALALSGAGLGLMRPNLVLWLLAATPPEVRGRTMGLLTSCFFIGQFLCPLITQPLVSGLGYGRVFVATAIITLLLSLPTLSANMISGRPQPIST